ncbi:hypothetical protein GGR58DRAFT_106659 [Xylaria digitata]|nr:hypothetical protein GGR58DRAFT_106659 [Xylaria digitata]
MVPTTPTPLITSHYTPPPNLPERTLVQDTCAHSLASSRKHCRCLTVVSSGRCQGCWASTMLPGLHRLSYTTSNFNRIQLVSVFVPCPGACQEACPRSDIESLLRCHNEGNAKWQLPKISSLPLMPASLLRSCSGSSFFVFRADTLPAIYEARSRSLGGTHDLLISFDSLVPSYKLALVPLGLPSLGPLAGSLKLLYTPPVCWGTIT